MRTGRLSAWATALGLAAGGAFPGWPLAMGAWTFHHTNNGSPAPDWR
ncbi:MAG: hypothetical protein MUD13_09155 [Candidatus Nanopelagicales bacterium]|jgi:hypothetical protein|nr:hypothetical protein [Candidatus Nanopelagicales bacterium]